MLQKDRKAYQFTVFLSNTQENSLIKHLHLLLPIQIKLLVVC